MTENTKQNKTHLIAGWVSEGDRDLILAAIRKISGQNGFYIPMSQFVRHSLLKEAKEILTRDAG